ncbi:hypothetical protein EIP91_000533 [Steccherinum ochraceum]|uniref:Yippee domain-containing protein n=1 Tax=Steccherinum ochraceum TaxID=92696 RepID=A0A4R0S355_9APHY|nr:hypothetical protein EIP91_000533 [Steccherinum ochraceum]
MNYSLGPTSRPRGTLVCKTCQTRIASRKSVLSWSFRGYSGKAALFTQVSHVIYNKPSVLLMDSGAHTVEEFSCETCSTLLGWRIVKAHEWPEKWKEGYSVLELELLDEPDSSVSPSPSPSTPIQQQIIVGSRDSGSDYAEREEGDEEAVDHKVVAFNAYLQVASALSMGHRRATSDMEARRPKPVGPRAITPTPPTPPRRSVVVRA